MKKPSHLYLKNEFKTASLHEMESYMQRNADGRRRIVVCAQQTQRERPGGVVWSPKW